jgi:hypothetical protein
MDKHYIVWYKALGGGLITSWLFQLCVNHKSLNEALNVFPVDLKDNNSNWFKYEKVPPNVGVISNGLYPNTYYNTSNYELYATQALDDLFNSNGDSIYTLLRARIKYYLTNFVWGKCWSDTTNIDDCNLDNIDYIKNKTKILFDTTKAIFVVAPEQYIEVANNSKEKKYGVSASDLFDIGDVIKNYDANVFYLQSLWNNTYVDNLELILNRKLTDSETKACEVLVNRWIDISSPSIKEYMYGN